MTCSSIVDLNLKPVLQQENVERPYTSQSQPLRTSVFYMSYDRQISVFVKLITFKSYPLVSLEITSQVSTASFIIALFTSWISTQEVHCFFFQNNTQAFSMTCSARSRKCIFTIHKHAGGWLEEWLTPASCIPGHEMMYSAFWKCSAKQISSSSTTDTELRT